MAFACYYRVFHERTAHTFERFLFGRIPRCQSGLQAWTANRLLGKVIFCYIFWASAAHMLGFRPFQRYLYLSNNTSDPFRFCFEATQTFKSCPNRNLCKYLFLNFLGFDCTVSSLTLSFCECWQVKSPDRLCSPTFSLGYSEGLWICFKHGDSGCWKCHLKC